MVQLFNKESLSGKTIQRVGYTENALVMFFTDDSYVVIQGCYFDSIDVEIYSDSYSLVPEDSNLSELEDLGVITMDEYRNLCNIKQQRIANEQRDSDLKKLAELKSKYPDAV